jgi:predicted site-specific integrase-resolvase
LVPDPANGLKRAWQFVANVKYPFMRAADYHSKLLDMARQTESAAIVVHHKMRLFRVQGVVA